MDVVVDDIKKIYKILVPLRCGRIIILVPGLKYIEVLDVVTIVFLDGIEVTFGGLGFQRKRNGPIISYTTAKANSWIFDVSYKQLQHATALIKENLFTQWIIE